MGYSLLNYLSLITIGISGLSILAGLFFIKKGKREAHRFFMINASIFALVFVLLYVLKSILYLHTILYWTLQRALPFYTLDAYPLSHSEFPPCGYYYKVCL